MVYPYPTRVRMIFGSEGSSSIFLLSLRMYWSISELGTSSGLSGQPAAAISSRLTACPRLENRHSRISNSFLGRDGNFPPLTQTSLEEESTTRSSSSFRPALAITAVSMRTVPAGPEKTRRTASTPNPTRSPSLRICSSLGFNLLPFR